jgi:hypothetical protein
MSNVNWPASRWPQYSRHAAAALLILLAAFVVAIVPAAAQRSNGAGMVIRHSDGSLIYVYVEFDTDAITSEDLLLRSGLQVIMAPYGGLGAGVCTLDGEGCPADNCFCHSYTNPAYFWHFYALRDGVWVEQLQGSSTREIRDGDVDGWSWTAGDSGLPGVTIDEIAVLNGIDRNAPHPTSTATPVPPTTTPVPTATPDPPPAQTPTPTAQPTASLATGAASSQTPSPQPSSPATESATVAAMTASPSSTSPAARIQPTRTAPPTRTASPTRTATRSNRTEPRPTATADGPAHAVLVEPGSTPVALDLDQRTERSGTRSGFLVFGAMAALVVGIGAIALARARQATGSG